jgi:HPt (histidine-containing phosphotransfer) domain-containing protein
MPAVAANDAFFVSSLASDPDLVDIVDLFVEELPARVAAIQQCLASADWQSLQRYAHQMKGACGSYGFHQLTPAASRLESSVREECGEDVVREAVEELIVLCRRVRSGRADAQDGI